MRLPWQFAGIWTTLRKNWRVRYRSHSRDDLVPQLFLRQLEERRVLTVGVMAQVGLESLANGVAPSHNPAVAGSTETSHAAYGDAALAQAGAASQSPAKVDAGLAPKDGADAAATAGTPAPQDSVNHAVALSVNDAALSLVVAPDQTTTEGAQLSITNIGQFTEQAGTGPFTYTIDWGDGRAVDSGSPTINVPGSPTSGSFEGQHIYADNGVYTVMVTVSDDAGGSDSKTLAVTVNDVAPTLTVAPNQTVNEGSQLSITNIGQFTDPGFDNPLNVGGETSQTFTYAINWGDGSPVDAGPATIDVHGSAGVLTAGSFNGQHIYADNGVYTVKVTVTDNDGGSDSKTLAVTVNDVAPTLTVAPNQTVNEGSQLSITNIGQFTDPGFDNPLNVGGPTTETFTYAINWGDGSPVNAGTGHDRRTRFGRGLDGRIA